MTLRLLDQPPVRGGEACVYAAIDDAGTRVAVKVAMHPGATWLAEEVAMLRRLAHTGCVVGVRGEGEWAGRPYVVLDWVGATLQDALPATDRLALAARLADAVATVHAADVVHRDLKPANVLLDGGRPLLCDFGAARLPEPGSTRTQLAAYSPGYAPPEQSLPGPQRVARDQDGYGLAATVFFALTGRAPVSPRHHALGTAPGLAPEDVRDLRRAVEGPVLELLPRMMAAEPAARSGSASDLAAALRASRPARRGRPAGVLFAVAGAIGVAGVLGAMTPSGSGYAAALVDGLLVGTFEVDQRTWTEVTGRDAASNREFKDGSMQRRCDEYRGVSLVDPAFPVVCVDWWDAVRFANALSARDGLPGAYAIAEGQPPRVSWDRSSSGWRLPTASEWQALAREVAPADACAVGNTGDRRMAAAFPGMADESPCDDGWVALAPVGSFPPDQHGLYDVYGNAAEWVWDDEPGAVVGGSWAGGAVHTRVAVGRPGPEHRGVVVGFRLVRDP